MGQRQASKRFISLLVMLLMAANVLMVFSVLTPTPRTVYAADVTQFNQMRGNWVEMLVGDYGTTAPSDPVIQAKIDVLDAKIAGYWSNMIVSTETGYDGRKFNDLNYYKDDPGNSGGYPAGNGGMRVHFERLKEMATAFKSPGSDYYGGPTIKGRILDGLDYAFDRLDHGPKNGTAKRGGYPQGQWWNWSISMPMEAVDAMALVYDELTAERPTLKNNLIINLVEEYNGMTQDEAANLMWRAYARTGLAILYAATDVNESDDWMRGTGMVFERMNEIFTKVAAGDGFYEDHSFIQHNYVGYTGSYGVHLFLTASKIIYICDASSATNSIGYRINSTHVPSIGTFKTSIGKSYQHLIFKGGVMDMVRGRAISRPDQESREVGLNAISGLVRLAYSVNTDYFTASEKAVYKQIVKEWVVPNLNTAYDYYSTDDIFGYVKSKVIVDDVNIAQTSLTSAVAYGAMDKAVQVNGNRAFGVSMVSRDSYHYEAIAQENKRGWYTNFGATYLYNQNDLLTFDNNYWATVEHNRLAGVTVVDGAAPLDYEGGHSVPADIDTTSRPSAGYWAGGVTIGGNHDGSTPDLYSVAAMYMKDFYSPLTAKKSWYMFDDEIVSLGSGISSSDSRNHITMIENRLLTDDLNTVFTVDDVQQLTLATSSTEQSYNKDDPQWAHLTKVGGFYFPDTGTKLRTKRVQNSGSWSLMKNGASSTTITNNFLSMWLRHGGTPSNAKYAYFILPLKTAYQTETYANSSTKAKVLRNDADVSSVREPNLKVTGITFWESNKSFTNADDGYTVTSSDKAIVMIKKDTAANVFEVVVSNPSRSTANSLTLTFSNQTVDAKLTSTSFISFQKSGSNLTSITCDLDAARTNGNPEMQFKIKFELN